MLVRVACVLLFLAWTAERPNDALLFAGVWSSPLAVFTPLWESLPGVRQPTWTLLLAGLAVACHLQPGALRRRAWPMDAALLASVGTIGLTFAWGILRGGSAYYAYYQLNALLLALLMAAVLLAAVRSPGDLKALGLTILAAALTRSVLALYFFFAFVRGTEPYPPHMTSHDDSPLFVAGIVVALSWALVRARWRTWLAAGVTILPILLAIKVNNRRVAWFELVAALAFLYLVIPDRRLRRKINRVALVAVPVLSLYAAVGWGRPGAIFTPLRAFDSTTGENQDASTMARNEENLNIILTYIQSPIAGTGWGRPMIRVSSAYAGFTGEFGDLYAYIPHNSLAALVAFSGVVGLVGILGIVPISAFLAARSAHLARRRADRAAAIAAVCVLPVFLFHAFADIGMQSLTNGLLLGVALGVSGRVSAWTGAWPVAGARRRLGERPASSSIVSQASNLGTPTEKPV